jgi:hypothetical protein
MTAEADERLRQEREAFEVNKAHARQWFALQVCTGYVGLTVFALVAFACIVALVCATLIGPFATTAAAFVLLGDIIALVYLTLKTVLSSAPRQHLEPVCRPYGGPRRES